MTLWRYVELRSDVFDRTLDDAVAPSLSEVVTGRAHRVYASPEEFVAITYPTATLKRLVADVLEAFASGTGRFLVLPSAFGGGKTHAMLLLYHLATAPGCAAKLDPSLGGRAPRVLEGVRVVVVDGTDRRTAPSPLEPLEEEGVRVRTLWGYVAHRLGAYEAVRMYDERLVTPDKSALLEVLSGRKVLLLVDELGVYYARLSRAPDPAEAARLRDYARQVVLFLRLLSECTKERGAATVVVLSIPAEMTHGGLAPEPGYEDFVRELGREVMRVAVVFERPIATEEDFTMVLVRRLFSRVDGEGASLAAKRLASLHSEYGGLVRDLSREVGRCYPFHPLYVRVLRELVERNRDLQRTRDALRISRRVLRSLKERVRDLMLVMPTDIDPRVAELRPYVITNSYLGFDSVLAKIEARTRELPVPADVDPDAFRDAAYRLALYVFLRTYLYDPHLEPRREFPSKQEVITGVYDEVRYERCMLYPPRLSDLLDALAGGGIEYRLPHLYSGEGYYWVTRLLDVRELVERESERVEDSDAADLVIKLMEQLRTRPYEGREEVRPRVFERCTVLPEPELVEHDDKGYVLLVLAPPLEDARPGAYSSGPLFDLVFYRRGRTQRRYANTVAVILSNNAAEWKSLLKTAKMVRACDRVQEELRRSYRDERVQRLLQDDLRRLREELVRSLRVRVVTSYFNLVAYPDVERSGGAPTRVVRVEHVREVAGRTTIELAEEALRRRSKVLEERYSRDFEVLAQYLARSETGIAALAGAEPEWRREVTVGDLKSHFFESPDLPMVSPQDVEEAILSGLRRMRVGVARGDRVFFKEVEGVGDPGRLQDSDVILPRDVAIDRQLEALSRTAEERAEGGLIVRRYYAVEREGEVIPVQELRSRYPESYREVFLSYRVRLREERLARGFELVTRTPRLEYRVGEAPREARIEVLVKRVGDFEGAVRLFASEGRVEPAEVVPDGVAVWTIPIPGQPGLHAFVLTATSADGALSRRASVEVLVRPGMACVEEPGERLLELRVGGRAPATAVRELLERVLRQVTGAKAVRSGAIQLSFREEREPRRVVEARFSGLPVEDVLRLLRALESAFGVTASAEFAGLELEVAGEGVVKDAKSLGDVAKRIRQHARVEFCY